MSFFSRSLTVPDVGSLAWGGFGWLKSALLNSVAGLGGVNMRFIPAIRRDAPSRPLPPRLRQFSKPSDQLPDTGGRRHFRPPGAFRISHRIGKQCAAALIGCGIRLPIAVEVVFQLTNHLLAGGWSAEGASKGSVRVSEMEQQPVLEARNRDGCANRDGTCLAVRLPGQPRTEAFDICVSFVVVEHAPNFVEVGIPAPSPALPQSRSPLVPTVLSSEYGPTRSGD